MPREVTISRTQHGVTRVYKIVYQDDPPEREEAVAFFERLGPHAGLWSRTDFLDSLHTLPIEEANAYLRDNPVPQHYRALYSQSGELTHDEDLRYLEYLPELEDVHLHSDTLTDRGIRYLRHLGQLKRLVLYLNRITNASLEVLRGLRMLRSLDLQGSPRLSRRACAALAQELGIRDYWGP